MPESTPPCTLFPDCLRTAREYRGLTQGELAERAGLQPSAISHFETGTRKPSFDNLRLLADTLDVDPGLIRGRCIRVHPQDWCIGGAGADRLREAEIAQRAAEQGVSQ